jgi:hypothetical protein
MRKVAGRAWTLLEGGEIGEGSWRAAVGCIHSPETLLTHLSHTPRAPRPGATRKVAARDAFARALIWPRRRVRGGGARTSRRREPMVWEGGAYCRWCHGRHARAGSHAENKMKRILRRCCWSSVKRRKGPRKHEAID